MASTLLTDYDLHLLAEGTHVLLYEKLGAHLRKRDGVSGVHFAVWAPNAERVSVIGDFNNWDVDANVMDNRPEAGVWETFIPNLKHGTLYKYRVRGRDGFAADKADPVGFAAEIRPQTASKVYDLSGYKWDDSTWLARRKKGDSLQKPVSIYEVHLGSWMRVPEEENRWLTYRELAQRLVDYVKEMGFTHVEFLPISEHPFDGSWGYQTVGYFAPTSRYGSPHDLMYLIDTLHQNDIGVILDWVPAHFPTDGHGLNYFDGTHLYEHADPRQGFHPHWNTLIFNFGRTEVQNFLVSNALFWFDRYHIDGLRVDAVASMLYLDYGRDEGGWVPNRYGGKENLEAIAFMRRANEKIYADYPGVMMIAEESTSWPMVSRPLYVGGLGYGFKWNMGWMHDILDYFSKDPVYRSFHHNMLTFSLIYAFHENFILPFSHDEVVHGKGSMLGKMPGDGWQKFANLRTLYGFMYGHPGKKMMFMGCEFGQGREWNHDQSLDWHQLDLDWHRGLQRWVRDLNTFYRDHPELYEADSSPDGFEWIDCNDAHSSTVSFCRWGNDRRTCLLFICNFTPVARENYRVGVPWGGHWREALNSDAPLYGGSGKGNFGGVDSSPVPAHGKPASLSVTVPPLGVVVFHGAYGS